MVLGGGSVLVFLLLLLLLLVGAAVVARRRRITYWEALRHLVCRFRQTRQPGALNRKIKLYKHDIILLIFTLVMDVAALGQVVAQDAMAPTPATTNPFLTNP